MARIISGRNFDRKLIQTRDLVREHYCTWYTPYMILESVLKCMSANAGTAYEVAYTEAQIKQMLVLAGRITDETKIS